jgi:Fur family ferric uptake transcriptional regulator
VGGVADDRLDAILALVRARGVRLTTPRRAIVQALLQAPDHVTAEELAAAVQAAHPDVHRSTVYRTLDTLTDLGVVVHAHLGHGPAVYHLADRPHYHLVCQRCGSVTELPIAVMAPLRRRLARDFRFELDATHFALAGRCGDCR